MTRRDHLMKLAARCESTDEHVGDLQTEIHEALIGTLRRIEPARQVLMSIDAARTLVPRGWAYGMADCVICTAFVCDDKGRTSMCRQAPTLMRALVSAILRGRAEAGT